MTPHTKTCDEPGCDKKHYGRGKCSTHHQALLRAEKRTSRQEMRLERSRRDKRKLRREKKRAERDMWRNFREWVTRRLENPESSQFPQEKNIEQ